jgi:hypothetical protein
MNLSCLRLSALKQLASKRGGQMHELIDAIVAKTGLTSDKAEAAVGVVLNLLKTQGNQTRVAELLAALPGADDLIARHAGRLTGMLAGGMMGGPLAAISKLSSLGLNSEQMKVMGTETLAFARAKAGDDLVRQVASNIPGIGGFL